VEGLEYTLASKIQCVNMVGGGIQDAFLCQLTADTLGKPVMTGPVEASAVGNILMQLKALNRIHDVAEGRKIVEGSFEMKEYRPN
jgi:rhamnulokinase